MHNQKHVNKREVILKNAPRRAPKQSNAHRKMA